MQTLLILLLIFTPIAGAGALLGFSPTALFFLSALAIIPLAKFIGDATEELAARTGPALGGLLNATFGNATELLIGVFAIRAGLIEVVKASLTGSIVGNLLLVLGTAMFAGGTRHKTQTFNRVAAHANASTLLLAIIALVIPAILYQTAPAMHAETTIEELSLAVSALMILIYVAGLWFALRTHSHFYAADTDKNPPKWSLAKSVTVLLIATGAVAAMSEILVRSIEPVAVGFGWTQLFIGVVVVAVVGNAAEHTSAIVMAIKNQMDLSLQISIGSATQIAIFVAPVLVLVSAGFATPMSLVFNTFEIVAIILSVLIVNQVVGDGESNWFEGLQLLVAYAIIATAFFLHN
ncbi:MAG TPA: calcium/proton exchanger [Candidatus Binataceae bacterium]|nr:calcium/proton exchanger [Candidatus Binataceae bacterium]